MTANSYRESATIYHFPKGGRAALGSRRDEVEAAEMLAPSRIARATGGVAWYHEEAVQTAERARKM